MRKCLFSKLISSIVFLVTLSVMPSFAQTGGTYDLSHNVIAGGGTGSTSGTTTVEGTVGQASAGAVSGSGNVRVRSGFWAFGQIGPTASTAVVTGRVLRANGGGIVNATVSLTDMFGGTQRVRTGTFGYFRFLNVRVGRDYFVTVNSRRYDFVESSIFITVSDEVSGIEFRALQ